MKKNILIILLITLIITSLAHAQFDPRKLTFPDIEFKPIKPNLEPIKKGMNFYYIEDHEIPVINLYIIFRSGKLYEKEGKEGLANLTYNLLLYGGTRNLEPNQVEEKLDFLGSRINVSVYNEYSYFSMWSLSKNFEKTFNILVDIINNPRFDESRLEVEKSKELEAIRRRWDDPKQIGFFLLNELIYGKNFQEIRRTTTNSINNITLNEIKSFYQEYILNKEIIVGATGDINPMKLKKILQIAFKKWKGENYPSLNIPKVYLFSKPGVYFINKEDLTQAIICAGHLGLNRLDSDNVEVSILNFIYGTGGFNSRLLREIRSNRGLAYSAYGFVGLGRDRGVFLSFTQTKNESTVEAIKLIIKIINDLINNKISEEELNTAIKSEQNSFIHKFNSPQSILLQYILLELQGYPKDYLETYIPRIKKVNVDKVKQLANKTMEPKNLIILVIGNKNEVLDQLESLNISEITELELPRE